MDYWTKQRVFETRNYSLISSQIFTRRDGLLSRGQLMPTPFINLKNFTINTLLDFLFDIKLFLQGHKSQIGGEFVSVRTGDGGGVHGDDGICGGEENKMGG